MTSGRISDEISEIVDIVASAGGELVGRTRLQKTTYLLKITGLGAKQFRFRYRHYGPFSENLATVSDLSTLLGSLEEEQKPSSWGGTFSVFRTSEHAHSDPSSPRVALIHLAQEANPVDLELAATAAYLALEGIKDPWAETAARKPDKAGNIESAKDLYRKLSGIDSPETLPEIV